jgi:hypothetical protein
MEKISQGSEGGPRFLWMRLLTSADHNLPIAPLQRNGLGYGLLGGPGFAGCGSSVIH